MNRLELAKKNFPDHYKAAIGIEDPSGGKHKYLLWIAKQLSSGHNAPDIAQTLKFFHENQEKFKIKDINKYKDLKSLEDIVKDFGLSNRKVKEKDKESSEKIYEDDNLMVIRVDDKPAMVLYGANTRWCTTMKDQSYYEDYVAQGNYFYIIIRKNEKALSSEKYAIVRKGLLEFNVYDANDNYGRDFSEEEEDKLRNAIQAIVSDRPQKNYILRVVSREIPAEEAAEWLKNQSDVTKRYIEDKRPELAFVLKSPLDLIGVFKSRSRYNYEIKLIPQEKLVEMAKELISIKDHSVVSIKLEVIKSLQNPSDKMIFAEDRDPAIRARIIKDLDPKDAKKFLSDKSIIAFKTAARIIDVQYLLDFASKLKSSRKKKAINEVIVERISQDKVREFVLNQPQEVLKELMV